jgi:hypothetical protein
VIPSPIRLVVPLLLVIPAACVPKSAAVSSSPTASAPGTRAPAAPSDAQAVAVGDAGTDATAPAQRLAMGPEGWRTTPAEDHGFYPVVDGLCSELEAVRVGKDVIVYYGGGGNPMYADQGGLRLGAASFVALRETGLENIGAPPIASPMGLAGASADDFWIADSTGSRSSESATIHRRVGGKWKAYGRDQTNLHAWLDGGVIGSLGWATSNGDLWVEGSSTKPPAAITANLWFPSLAAFPSGDVLVIGSGNPDGSGPGGPLVARHWAPGGKVRELPLDKLLPKVGDETRADVYEVAPDEVYVSRAGALVRWDGKDFRKLGKTSKGANIVRLNRAGSDDVWVTTSGATLEHITAAGATPVATPESIASMDGFQYGSAWAVGRSGKLYRRDGEAWTAVPLPSPVFTSGGVLKAKRVRALAKDDVVFIGKYWEKGPFWKDQELHTVLFRTRPTQETLRCNEPDPENNNTHLGQGFQSWPPMATAECKTPFAVLARRSNAAKGTKPDDWPRIRSALKSHTELGDVSLVDFVSGDRTFVGVKTKDLEGAKKLVELVAKRERLRPEIVCGDPTAVRTLPLDLATGNVVGK